MTIGRGPHRLTARDARLTRLPPPVMANAAKQSRVPRDALACFAALAMTG
jgi:hypothetical protein